MIPSSAPLTPGLPRSIAFYQAVSAHQQVITSLFKRHQILVFHYTNTGQRSSSIAPFLSPFAIFSLAILSRLLFLVSLHNSQKFRQMHNDNILVIIDIGLFTWLSELCHSVLSSDNKAEASLVSSFAFPDRHETEPGALPARHASHITLFRDTLCCSCRFLGLLNLLVCCFAATGALSAAHTVEDAKLLWPS